MFTLSKQEDRWDKIRWHPKFIAYYLRSYLDQAIVYAIFEFARLEVIASNGSLLEPGSSELTEYEQEYIRSNSVNGIPGLKQSEITKVLWPNHEGDFKCLSALEKVREWMIRDGFEPERLGPEKDRHQINNNLRRLKRNHVLIQKDNYVYAFNWLSQMSSIGYKHDLLEAIKKTKPSSIYLTFEEVLSYVRIPRPGDDNNSFDLANSLDARLLELSESKGMEFAREVVEQFIKVSNDKLRMASDDNVKRLRHYHFPLLIIDLDKLIEDNGNMQRRPSIMEHGLNYDSHHKQ